MRLILAFCFFSFSSFSVFASDFPPAIPGEYIVKFNSRGLEQLQNDYPEMRNYSLREIKQAIQSLMGLNHQKTLGKDRAELTRHDSKKGFDLDFILRVKESGLVDYIEPNYRYKIDAITNDTFVNDLWGLNNTGQNGGTNNVDIDAPEAWAQHTANTEVVVGVIDTGVDYNHPDLAANIWHNSGEIPNNGIDDDMNGVIDDYYGYNTIDDNGDPFDNNDHGTHVSGTIAAVSGNSRGIAGVANNVKIMALKFLDADGFGSSADAVEAIEYAINAKINGVNIRILNNSWAGDSFSQALYDAVKDASNAGILFVASAGNSKLNNDFQESYPANYGVANPTYNVSGLTNVVSVAAVTNTGYLAGFSNYGANSVHVAAPGVGILSTIPNSQYISYSGTSMAAPHVSGVAAMVFGKKTTYSPASVRSILINSSKHLPNLEGLVVSAGIISASSALGQNANEAPVIQTISTQTLYQNGPSKTVTISASDGNGDTLSYSAAINPIDYQAYQLDSSLDFWTNGDYYTNSWGYQEKWFRDKDSRWYFITPNANIFRVDSINQTPMVAVLDIAYYNHPEKLLNAATTYAEPATLSMSGNKLTITPATDYLGEFTVRVTVSDGIESSYQNFAVKVVKNYAPKISAIDDKIVLSGYQLITRVYTSDADNDNISLSASSSNSAGLKVTTSRGYLTLIPQGSFLGDVEVTVTARDFMHTTSSTFKTTVISKAVAGSLASDNDKDGVLNFQELEDGTDPYDSGSYNQYFTGTAYGLWNGYLGMTNVLELSNDSFQDCTAYVSMYSNQGNRTYHAAASIKKQGQRDVDLNKLKGFKADAYGVVKITSSCAIDGRISYYRSSPAGEFEFAFSVPVGDSLVGKSAVSFNTFQPSSDPTERNNVVENWLSIVNLASTSKRFKVYSYNADGNLILTRRIFVTPRARLDLDGGHGFAGANSIGLHRIIPEDGGAPYLAQLMRYGTNSLSGQSSTAYSFGYPLMAHAGSGRKLNVMISNTGTVENWVEIVNTNSNSTRVKLEFRNSKGYLALNKTIEIPGFSQRHISVASILNKGDSGTLSIDGSSRGSIIAHSMYYYRDSANGKIQAMYGVRAQEAVGQSLTGTFNFYLNMDNWLKIANTTENLVTITVQVNNGNISTIKKYYLNAFASIALPLHDSKLFKTSSSTLGLVFVQTNKPLSIISELLRVRTSNSGNYEFISPSVLN